MTPARPVVPCRPTWLYRRNSEYALASILRVHLHASFLPGAMGGSSSKTWDPSSAPDLSGKTALVTGANSGLGLETVKRLAAKGATVVMACRSEERATRAMDEVRREQPDAKVEFLEVRITRPDAACVPRAVRCAALARGLICACLAPRVRAHASSLRCRRCAALARGLISAFLTPRVRSRAAAVSCSWTCAARRA
jgi:hypothetical protein